MIGIDNCDYRFCHLQIKVVRQSLPHQHHRQSVARPIVAKQFYHNPRVGGSSPSSATILESVWVRTHPLAFTKSNKIIAIRAIRVRMRPLAFA